jgi:uncharacterized Zn-binding protein involved in type VI secretion
MKLALDGAPCEASGHPSSCQEPAPGSVDAPDTTFTVNDVQVGSHGGSMFFPSHAHTYTSESGCTDHQSHSLDPDETPSFTLNGEPVYRVADSTTDPVSGGVAEIVGPGTGHEVTHNV